MSQTLAIPADLLAATHATCRLLDHLAGVTDHLATHSHPSLSQIEELDRLITEADSRISSVRRDLNEACPKRPNDHDEALQVARDFIGVAAPACRTGWNPNGFNERVWLGSIRIKTHRFRPCEKDYPRLDSEVRQAALRRAEKCGNKRPTATRQDNELHPDGPEGGRWLWWDGTRHDVPTGNVYGFLSFFWGRTWASYDELKGPVFEQEVVPQTIRSEVCATNAVLRNLGIPWSLSTDSRERVVSKGDPKPARVKKRPIKNKSKPRGSKRAT